MTKQGTRAITVLFIAVLAFSALAAADNGVSPLGLIIQPEPQPLSINIWTDKAMYAFGENATIFFNVNQPAYIYIYDIQPDGIVRMLFPNQYSQANYVSAGIHTLPDGLYKFTVAPPAGVEQLQIFASLVPLGVAPMAYTEPYPLIGMDPQSAGQSIEAQIMGLVPVPNYVTAWTSFTITGGYGYTPPSYTPPSYTPPSYTPPSYTPPSYMPPSYTPPSYGYGPYYYPPFVGYPGGTWYWQDGDWHFGLPGSGWYWFWGEDGQWHFRIRIRINFGS